MTLPIDPSKFYTFLVTMTLMAISPGPANLFFVRTGLSGRKSRVFAGVIGTNSASLVWFAASALGLQALMTAFPLVFQIIGILGGLYVFWLGYKTARQAIDVKNEVVDFSLTEPVALKSFGQTLREGFLVQMLNPKALLFFSAVLPPFVDIHRPMPPQMIVFAIAMISLDVVSMTTYGLGAVRLSKLLRQPKYKQGFDLGAGAILMMIALVIVIHAIREIIAA